jgi:hypothetical protein
MHQDGARSILQKIGATAPEWESEVSILSLLARTLAHQ